MNSNDQIQKTNPKDYQKKWLINVPQMLYKYPFFLPVFKNKNKINQNSKKTIIMNNICKIDILSSVLNQTHANIINTILYNVIDQKIDQINGKYYFLMVVALNEILKTLNLGKNYFWFYKKINEIKTAKFKAYDVSSDHKAMPCDSMPLIIDIIDYQGGKMQSRYIGFKKMYAPYKVVIFSPLFTYLMQNYLIVSYPKTLFLKIRELKYSVNQAIVRYCLASGNVNESLEKLLVKLDVATGKIDSKDHFINKYLKLQYFSHIKEEQDKLLEYFNIEIKPLKNKELGVFRKIEIGDVVRIHKNKSNARKKIISKNHQN